jgi:hypothetical protein
LFATTSASIVIGDKLGAFKYGCTFATVKLASPLQQQSSIGPRYVVYDEALFVFRFTFEFDFTYFVVAAALEPGFMSFTGHHFDDEVRVSQTVSVWPKLPDAVAILSRSI